MRPGIVGTQASSAASEVSVRQWSIRQGPGPGASLAQIRRGEQDAPAIPAPTAPAAFRPRARAGTRSKPRLGHAVELTRLEGLGEVQVGEPQAIHRAHQVVEEGHGVLVHDDAVEVVHHRIEADAHAAEGQFAAHRLQHLAEQAGAVGVAAAVVVVTGVAAAGEELVEEVAVGGMDLHAVEARVAGLGGGPGEVGDDAGDFPTGQRMRRHRFLQARRREHLPSRIDRRWRHRL